MNLPDGAILSVEIKIEANSHTNRKILQYCSAEIRLLLPNPEDDNSDISVLVGCIQGWKTLSTWTDHIISAADEEDEDLYQAFEWFNRNAENLGLDSEYAFTDPVLYVDRVVISSEFRGLGIVLPAVAAFIDAMSPEVVIILPHNVNVRGIYDFPTDSKLRDAKKEDFLLDRLWRKLGLKSLPGSKYLYSYPWHCPKWIQTMLHND